VSIVARHCIVLIGIFYQEEVKQAQAYLLKRDRTFHFRSALLSCAAESLVAGISRSAWSAVASSEGGNPETHAMCNYHCKMSRSLGRLAGLAATGWGVVLGVIVKG
jgi:hypothetical protein